jgi:hypothetical protein
MLATQIGFWAFNRATNEDGLAPHRMLPILINENTEDLVKVVRRKLNSWLNEKVDYSRFVRCGPAKVSDHLPRPSPQLESCNTSP